MKWLRLYDDLLDDPKAQQLPPALFKHWINLLCLASKTEPRGTLPDMAAVAFRLRVSPATARKATADLIAAGLIDQQGETLQMHNWNDRQRPSDNVAARVRKHRESVSGNGSVTLQETLPERSGNALEEEGEKEGDGEENPPGGPPAADAAAQAQAEEPKPKPPKRKRQIDENFVPSVALTEWATTELGLDAATIRRETEKFTDHFWSKGETRVDWPASWRNWMRRVAEGTYGPVRPGQPGHSPAPPAHPWPNDRELSADERTAAAERWRTGATT